MPGIFDDEGGENGEIRSNPVGQPHFPPGCVAQALKWPAPRRLARLSREKMGAASTAILILNRPYDKNGQASAKFRWMAILRYPPIWDFRADLGECSDISCVAMGGTR